MNATIAVPLWAVFMFMGLMVAQHIAATVRDRAMRDLWRMYWKAQYGTEDAP